MSFHFRPAVSFTERHGLFVALVGGTNSGKTYSALRLARGIAGPSGKIAVADTEGGRTLHLKDQFSFDVAMVDPPHRPQRYAEIARDAEEAGYDALVIDSFSAEWAGLGGVLSWADEEAQRMANGDDKRLERVKGASWIKPKQAHKSMVYSLLGRRIPIIFSIRGEETFKPPAEKFFKAVCNQGFLFEVTVSFRLASERKGIIDLSDPKSWKMEGAHRSIFKDGEQLSEAHGEALATWAKGGAAKPEAPPAQDQGPPRLIEVPSDETGAHMWAEWGKAFASAIKGAATAAELDAWMKENAVPLMHLAEAAPKMRERLNTIAAGRLATLQYEGRAA